MDYRDAVELVAVDARGDQQARARLRAAKNDNRDIPALAETRVLWAEPEAVDTGGERGGVEGFDDGRAVDAVAGRDGRGGQRRGEKRQRERNNGSSHKLVIPAKAEAHRL